MAEQAASTEQSTARFRLSIARSEAIASDIEVLNNVLKHEHQTIWAYRVAVGNLSKTDTGNALMQVVLFNLAGHEVHRNTLIQVIHNLRGTPANAASKYDISTYLDRGDGGFDSDLGIAKLILALETDMAKVYHLEVNLLRTPELVTAGAAIALSEAHYATTIRAAFPALRALVKYSCA